MVKDSIDKRFEGVNIPIKFETVQERKEATFYLWDQGEEAPSLFLTCIKVSERGKQMLEQKEYKFSYLSEEEVQNLYDPRHPETRRLMDEWYEYMLGGIGEAHSHY